MQKSPRRSGVQNSSPKASPSKKINKRRASVSRLSNALLDKPTTAENTEVKPTRKSVGRRVSFAATAHVRLFDTDPEGWNQKSDNENEFDDAFDMLPVSSSQKLDFQMPDLSSVRRNSETFDLRLSLPGPDASQDESMEIDQEKEHSSFDISLKGSPIPNPVLPAHYNDNAFEESNNNILSSIDRRDSIACFFNSSNQSTPTLMNRRGSSFGKINHDMVSNENVEMDISVRDTLENLKYQETAESIMMSPVINVLPKPTPIVSNRRSTRHRDSIACFFESPKLRNIITNGADVNQDVEVTMDIESPSRESESCSPIISLQNTPIKNSKPNKQSDISVSESAVYNPEADESIDIPIEDEYDIQPLDMEPANYDSPLSKMMISKTPVKSEKKDGVSMSSNKKSDSLQYSFSPSLMSAEYGNEKSKISPKSRLAKAVSSPYTPRIRSKLSQSVSELTSSEEDNDSMDNDPMTQTDLTMSQSTMANTQETPAKVREYMNESQYDVMNNFNEDDLMDEHLSMADNSFSQEVETYKINSLSDFLKATGISFNEEITTSFRRESIAFSNDIGAPLTSEYSKASCVWFPELEIYEFGCQELSHYIEDGKVAMRERESEILASQPLIFYEFSTATDEERNEIIDQLNSTKMFTILETKESWYTWRQKLLEPLEETLDTNTKYIARDERYCQQYEEKFNSIIEEASLYREELKVIIADTKKRRTDQEKELDLEQTKLKSEEENQRIELEEAERELEFLKSQAALEALNEEAYLLEISSINEAILTAQETVSDLTLFQPEDLTHLKQEFRLLYLTHRWMPIQISGSKLTLLYDLSIKASFDLNGDLFYPVISVSEVEPEFLKFSGITATSEERSNIFTKWGVENIKRLFDAFQKSLSECASMEDIIKILDNISGLWEQLKTLTQDISLAQEECMIEIGSISLKSPLPTVHATFFSYKNKRRFKITFIFADMCGNISYPHGKWNWTFKNIYGDVTEFKVTKSLGWKEDRLGKLCQALVALIES